ncbi:MAG: ABC transporter permease [Planctomycetaceae bacterium]
MFAFALSNLASRKLRSSLSTLGLTVAIAGMVGLFSIAEGIDQAVNQAFQQIPGLLVQQRGAPVPIFSTLPASWEEELEAHPGLRVVNPEVLSRINLLEGESVISPPRFLLGLEISSRLQLNRDVYRENIVAGRFLEMEDQGTLNCILSQAIAEEQEKGVNDDINIGGVDCHVVGIYHSGSMMIDVSILMDIESVRRTTRFDENTVSCYYMEIDDTVPKAQLKAELEEQFSGRSDGIWRSQSTSGENPLGALIRSFDKQLRPAVTEGKEPSDDSSSAKQTSGGKGAIEVRTAEDWAERFDEFTEDLNLFLTVMTTIGVVIAVLSIVNTMLMSVTERTIDFGILRANGWRARDIVSLVTFESALIGLIGGILGAFFGWVATHVINWNWPDRMQLFASPQLLVFAVLFSIGMGILGGVYPAFLAARLSPMEAIRRG